MARTNTLPIRLTDLELAKLKAESERLDISMRGRLSSPCLKPGASSLPLKLPVFGEVPITLLEMLEVRSPH
jgi:hypothetical protein